MEARRHRYRHLGTQTANINREISQEILATELVNHGQEFLRLAEREDRNQHTTTPPESFCDRFRQATLFARARPACGGGVIAACTFHDHYIDLFLGEVRRLHDGLIVKLDVTRVEDRLGTRAQHDSSGAEHMPGVEKFESNDILILGAGAFPGNRNALPHWAEMPLIESALGFAVREEGIKSRADLFPLPCHHVDRVMQKNAAYFTSSIGHEDARVRLPPHQHRQRADVILVCVRKQNGVEFSITQSLEIRQSCVPFVFGCIPESRTSFGRPLPNNRSSRQFPSVASD